MPPANKKAELTDSKRQSILEFLLTRHDAGNKCNALEKGAIGEAMQHFELSRSTVQRVWKRVVTI